VDKTNRKKDYLIFSQRLNLQRVVAKASFWTIVLSVILRPQPKNLFPLCHSETCPARHSEVIAEESFLLYAILCSCG